LGIWYHGTSEERMQSILRDGFRVPTDRDSFQHRMGTGVYFAPTPNQASDWGDCVIEAEIDMDHMQAIRWRELVATESKKMLFLPESIRDHFLGREVKGLVVESVDESKTLVVYDLSAIRRVKKGRQP
jgi:hypothetical protein